MTNGFRKIGPCARLAIGIGLVVGLIPSSNAVEKGEVMTVHAQGTFEVKLTPQLPEDKSEGSTLGRMLIEKQFHSDLEAVSHGQMLTGM
jgi:hypothetical protein